MIERQQQQIKHLGEIASNLQLENLRCRLSELKPEMPHHNTTLSNELGQRIAQQDRGISDVYKQALLHRASELDTFGDQDRLAFPSRKLIDYDKSEIHNANIKLDMEAVVYLESCNPQRIAQVTRGFEKRYGMVIPAYYEFGFCDAPDAVIDALNKKSDLEHLPVYSRLVDDERKLQVLDICDEVIRQWKSFGTSSDGEPGGFSITTAERQMERVCRMMETLNDEMQGYETDETDLSDGFSMV